MGHKIAQFILKNRIPIVILVLAMTVFMGFIGKDVEIRYQMPRFLPTDHVDWTSYKSFKENFGTDGFQILVGVKDDEFFTPKKFNEWKKMGEEFKQMNGVDSVFSEALLYVIKKDDSLKKFHLKRLINEEITSQIELDSLSKQIRNYPFYEGSIYNDTNNFHVMLLIINQEFFDSKERGTFVKEIQEITKRYEQNYKSEIYLTGLPFIRASNLNNIKGELKFFTILSLIATIIVLFFFFRSFIVIGVASTIVALGAIWSMGLMGLFGFQITALMGLLPPLIIVIGIPNCVYLINKYQQVYIETKDKHLALKTIIIKIGHITLLTNATTAFGLGTFAFTDTLMLVEFGIVASVGILALFLITVLLIPIFFSWLPEPKERQTKHLEKGWLAKFLKILEHLATNKRKLVYLSTAAIVIVSVFGAYLLRSTGRIMDDLPNGDKAKTDLVVYQENLAGIMPFEVVLDLKKSGMYQNPKVLKKMDSVQRYLESHKEVSKTLSMVDALKFVNQAFYNGNPEKYELPKGRDKGFIKKYIKNNNEEGALKLNSFIDSTQTKTRISANLHDIGLEQLDSLIEKVEPHIDKIFNPDKGGIDSLISKIQYTEKSKGRDLEVIDSLLVEYPQIENSCIALVRETDEETADKWYDEGINKSILLGKGKDYLIDVANRTYVGVTLTGFTVPFTRGTKYLIFNLFISLLIAIVGISLLMSFLFRSFKMVLITILTNLIPLVFTAGIMGYLGVTLKPSTILVFSISLGIAVDDAIHYLAKYRQELKATGGDVRKSVYSALRETGVSMLYTSIILFFGFSIFIWSNYGGTQALGLLTSLTLLVAMLSNLVLLPALLLTFKAKNK